MDDIADMNNQELIEALDEARAEEVRLKDILDDMFYMGLSVDGDPYLEAEMNIVYAEQRISNIQKEMRNRAADLAAAEDDGTFRQGFLNKLRSMRP